MVSWVLRVTRYSLGDPMKNHTLRPLLAPALLIGISFIILAPTSLYPWGRDQGMFAYAGHLVRGGAVPFRDFWDTKAPAIYYVYACAELIFGFSMRAVRMFDIAWQCATAAVLFAIARRSAGGNRTGFAAGMLYVLAYASRGWWNTAQPDDFLNLPVALAVLFALKARARGPSPGLLFAAGALAGVAFWFRYPMGLMAAACAATVWRGSLRESWRERAAAGIGFAVIAGGYGLYLRAGGAWGEFVYAEFVWARAYAALEGEGGPLHLGEFLRSHVSVAALGLLALAGAARACRSGRPGAPAALGALWAAIALANLYLGNKFYVYHYAPLLAPLAIAAAWMAAVPFERAVPPFRRAVAAVAVLCACAASWYLVNPRYNAYCLQTYADTVRAMTAGGDLDRYYMNIRFTSDDYSLPADMAVARYLREKTSPGDAVFIWGCETTVYALAGRRCASRFIHNFPFLCGWTPARFGDELLGSLVREQPKYLLLVRNDPAWWATGTREDSFGALRRYPALERYIAGHYHREAAVEDFLILARIPPGHSGTPTL